MNEKRWDALIKRFSFSKKIIGAEIGVYKGKLSKHLLGALPQLELYAIDRWNEYSKKEKESHAKTSIVYTNLKSWEDIYQKILKIQRKYIDRYHIIRMDSVKASEQFEDGYFDFVFIDANHFHEAVKKDNFVWYPKVKNGGYLCGHDYNLSEVSRAVNECFNNVELDIDKTWWVKK